MYKLWDLHIQRDIALMADLASEGEMRTWFRREDTPDLVAAAVPLVLRADKTKAPQTQV
jgi:hypothetical protein